MGDCHEKIVLADGMDVTFPLSYIQLQGPGRVTSFDYRVTVSISVSENSLTGNINIDMAPDVNLHPASTDRKSIHSTLSPIPTTLTAEEVRDNIIDFNITKPEFPWNCLVRWSTPIEVNTNGIPQAEKALDRYEVLTGGLITFNRVNYIPANGVVFVEGDAVSSDGSPGCGNMTPDQGFQSDSNGNLLGLYYIHLGSVACNDATAGDYDSAVAEHEMGHALGVLGHFNGYTGPEGLMNPNFFNVVFNIYDNHNCTIAEALNITLVEVGEFGFYY